MSRERKQKLAQSRRRNVVDEEDGDNHETGPALIDDSASEANSDDDLQLSGSDNEDEEEEEDGGNHKSVAAAKDVKGSLSPPTSESYDRLEDDTLQGADFVDLAASNGSVGAAKLTDTAVILNGFKDIPTDENGGASDGAMQFDEWDNTTFEPLPSQKTQTAAQPPSRGRGRGAARDRPDRETYWQRRNRDKEEYKKRLEDPTFTPYVGEFFMHDSRKNRQFDSLNQFGPRGRGRGRGGRGFRGGFQRDLPGRNGVQEESSWGHDGFEELEPQQSSRPGSSRVCLHDKWSDFRQRRKVKRAQLDVKLLCRVRMMALIPLHRQHNRRRRPKLQNRLKILAIQKPIVQMYPLSLVSSSP
jgi:hypothetical protein